MERQEEYSLDNRKGDGMNTDVMFSSNTDNWATPQELFNELNSEFHFTLDPCADDKNHKCDKYFTRKEDGLLQNWGGNECSVIPLMVKKYINGLRNVIKKVVKNIQLLFCSYRQEPILNIFMILFCIEVK